MNDVNTAMQVVDLTKLYWMVGALIVTNIGTVGSVLYMMGKALWWVSKLDSRVAQNTKDVNAAHARLREVEC